MPEEQKQKAEQPVPIKKLHKQIYLGGVSQKDILFFTKNLSILIKTGSTISEALEVLRQQSKGKLVETLSSINEEVQRGINLSEAMSHHPKVFSMIYINMIKIGEQSGTLEQNLAYITKQLEAQYKLRKNIVSAMVYPAIIFFGTFALAGGIVFYVLPKITQLFRNFNVALPLTTRILIGISDFFQKFGIWAVVLIIAAFVLLSWIMRNKFTKPYYHLFLLQLPIVNNIIKHYNLSAFYRNLNILLKSGVTIDEGLSICSNTTNNERYKGFLKDANAKIKSGGSLYDVLQAKPSLFFATDCQIINVGEGSGTLADSLAYCAEIHEDALEDITKNLNSILEPVLFVIIGVMVGVLALAVITPIYSITQVFQ